MSTAVKCRASGCNLPALVPWAVYCNTHNRQQFRTGHPTRRSVSRGVRTEYRKRVLATMERAARSPGMREGLKAAERVLNYAAASSAAALHRVEAHFTRLRAGGVEPWHVLQCVAECVAVWRNAYDGMFASDEVFTMWFARQVLLLARGSGRGIPDGTVLRYVGALLRDELFKFGLGLVAQMERDEAAKVERVRSWADPDAWVSPPLKRRARPSPPGSRRRTRPRNPVTGTFLSLAEEARLRAEGRLPPGGDNECQYAETKCQQNE